MIVAMLSGCTLYTSQGRTEAVDPRCDIEVANSGGWITVDVSSSCAGDWYLEYRTISEAGITVSRVSQPCDELTTASILATPGTRTMRVAGALISESRDQRVDCTIADHTVTVAE